MWKIVLLVSLIPPIAVVAMRKWFCDRVLQKLPARGTNQTGEKLAGHLARHFKLSGIFELKKGKRTGLKSGEPSVLSLSEADWAGKDIASLARVALLVSRAAAERDHAPLWGWRDWAIRFGIAFPAFTLLVVVFAVAVAKLSGFVAIVIVVGAFALASLFLLATMPVELEAARQAATFVERTNALPRQSDGEEVARCCHALAWSRIVPGSLEWAVGKPGIGGRNSLEGDD